MISLTYADIWIPGGARILSDEVLGRRVYRLIPSRYPPISIYENLLDAGELELAYELESLTNDRLRDEAGDIAYVPSEERMVGPGCSVVMAAFTHVGVKSRFSSGEYGVFYAGLELETAIEESKTGQVRFLSATDEPPFEITMRAYATKVALPLLDIRGPAYNHCHDPNDWFIAQQFGREARDADENGLWYRSVRNVGGECIAGFRTLAVEPVTQAKHYRFAWDGTSIAHVYEINGVA